MSNKHKFLKLVVVATSWRVVFTLPRVDFRVREGRGDRGREPDERGSGEGVDRLSRDSLNSSTWEARSREKGKNFGRVPAREGGNEGWLISSARTHSLTPFSRTAYATSPRAGTARNENFGDIWNSLLS